MARFIKFINIVRWILELQSCEKVGQALCHQGDGKQNYYGVTGSNRGATNNSSSVKEEGICDKKKKKIEQRLRKKRKYLL